MSMTINKTFVFDGTIQRVVGGQDTIIIQAPDQETADDIAYRYFMHNKNEIMESMGDDDINGSWEEYDHPDKVLDDYGTDGMTLLLHNPDPDAYRDFITFTTTKERVAPLEIRDTEANPDLEAPDNKVVLDLVEVKKIRNRRPRRGAWYRHIAIANERKVAE